MKNIVLVVKWDFGIEIRLNLLSSFVGFWCMWGLLFDNDLLLSNLYRLKLLLNLVVKLECSKVIS